MLRSILAYMVLLVSVVFAQNGQQQNTQTTGLNGQPAQVLSFPTPQQPFSGQGTNIFSQQPGASVFGVQTDPNMQTLNAFTGQQGSATAFQNTLQTGGTQTSIPETAQNSFAQSGIITSQGQTFVTGGQPVMPGSQVGAQVPQTGGQVPANTQINGQFPFGPQMPGQFPFTPGQNPFAPQPGQLPSFPQNGQPSVGNTIATGGQNQANTNGGNVITGQNPFGINTGNQFGASNTFEVNPGNQIGVPSSFVPNAGNQIGGPTPFPPNNGNQIGGPTPFPPNTGNQIGGPTPFPPNTGNQIGGPTPFGPNAGNQFGGATSFGPNNGVPTTFGTNVGTQFVDPSTGNQIATTNPFGQNSVNQIGGQTQFGQQTVGQPQQGLNGANQIGGQLGPQIGGFNPNLPPPSLACHTRGCPSGAQCVFAGPGDHMCPTWIPILPCQCRQGCRTQNRFIPLGTSLQIDVCGNRCTCNSADGQAACTMMACPQQGKK